MVPCENCITLPICKQLAITKYNELKNPYMVHKIKIEIISTDFTDKCILLRKYIRKETKVKYEKYPMTVSSLITSKAIEAFSYIMGVNNEHPM